MGLWYEDLEPGRVIRHPIARTMTEADNVLFTCMTMNTQPLHLDAEFAAKSEFGQRLVNSLFTLAVTVGISVTDISAGTTVANLAFEQTDFPAPVFHGDTLRVETEVTAARPSRSRRDAGIVTFEHRAINQRQELVVRARRVALMKRRPVAGAEQR